MYADISFTRWYASVCVSCCFPPPLICLMMLLGSWAVSRFFCSCSVWNSCASVRFFHKRLTDWKGGGGDRWAHVCIEHDFPWFVSSGSQAKKNQGQTILRFFFFLFFKLMWKTFRLKKRERNNIHPGTFLLVTVGLVAFTSLLQTIRMNPPCGLYLLLW